MGNATGLMTWVDQEIGRSTRDPGDIRFFRSRVQQTVVDTDQETQEVEQDAELYGRLLTRLRSDTGELIPAAEALGQEAFETD